MNKIIQSLRGSYHKVIQFLRKSYQQFMESKIIQFMRESYQEFMKITWPTKESLWGGTLGVILISLFFVLFMFIIDFIVSKVIQVILG